MGQNIASHHGFSHSQRLFARHEDPLVSFPIQHVEIDWDRLIDKRPMILAAIEHMPGYLLRPEVLILLEAEKHPTYRLILDLMWTTGAKVSEVLGLTPSSFIDDGYDFGVTLNTPKRCPGRPKKMTLLLSPKRLPGMKKSFP